MCKYCKENKLILKEEHFEISIKDKEIFIDTDPSYFDEAYYIAINYCPVCGEKLTKEE